MLYFRSVQLTESGERFIDDVIAHVFQFINLLKTSDKEYIYWPDRKEQIEGQIDKLLSYTRK